MFKSFYYLGQRMKSLWRPRPESAIPSSMKSIPLPLFIRSRKQHVDNGPLREMHHRIVFAPPAPSRKRKEASSARAGQNLLNPLFERNHVIAENAPIHLAELRQVFECGLDFAEVVLIHDLPASVILCIHDDAEDFQLGRRRREVNHGGQHGHGNAQFPD